MAKGNNLKADDDVFDKDEDKKSESNSTDADAREIALMEKEEELARKEAELKARETALANAASPATPTAKLAAAAATIGKRQRFPHGEKLVQVKVAPRRSISFGKTEHFMPGEVIDVSFAEKDRLIKQGFAVDVKQNVDTETDNIISSLNSPNEEGATVTVGAIPNTASNPAPGLVSSKS